MSLIFAMSPKVIVYAWFPFSDYKLTWGNWVSWDSFCFSCHSYDPQRLQIYYSLRIYFITLLFYSCKVQRVCNLVWLKKKKKGFWSQKARLWDIAAPLVKLFNLSKLIICQTPCLSTTLCWWGSKWKKYVNVFCKLELLYKC